MTGETDKIRASAQSTSTIIIMMVLLVLIGVGILVARENNTMRANDQAEIEMIVHATNSFAREIRCIRETTWMLTSPEAREAVVQQRLAAAGLPAARVDLNVLRRLEFAAACREPS